VAGLEQQAAGAPGATPTVEQYRNLKNPGSHLPSFRFLQPYLEGRRVLDLGCAGGVYLRGFAPGSVGLDASAPNLEECRRQGLTVLDADLNQPFPVADETFEVAFASHVLEHVDAPVSFLRECRRVLVPGGALILGLPIEHSLIGLIDGYYRSHPGHLYSFSVRCLRQLLSRSGFVLDRVFVDVPCAGRSRLMTPLLHLAQHLPYWLTGWWCGALWAVGRKQTIDSRSR